jgi:hypothetical protein
MPDYRSRHFPSSNTLACSLIYVTPLLWFFWFGSAWKAASVVSIAVGVWRSPGFLRRLFGLLFLVSILVWGGPVSLYGLEFPGNELFLLWWYVSWGTRCHADGSKAEADARIPQEWE